MRAVRAQRGAVARTRPRDRRAAQTVIDLIGTYLDEHIVPRLAHLRQSIEAMPVSAEMRNRSLKQVDDLTYLLSSPFEKVKKGGA